MRTQNLVPRPRPIGVVAVPVTLYLSCCAAPGTALRLVGIASRGKKLLFLGAKGKGFPAIETVE